MPDTDVDEDAGDGTVPFHSAQLVEGLGFKAIFRMRGIEHSASYTDENVLQNVPWCIGKLVQLATPVKDLPQKRGHLMAQPFRTGRFALCLALLAGGLAMTDANIANAASLSDKPAVCFGRLMVDLPPGAEPGLANVDYRFGLIGTERSSASLEAFNDRMASREVRVKQAIDTEHYQYVRTRRISNPMPAWLFVSRQKTLISGELYRLEFHAKVDDVIFSVANDPYGADKVETIATQLETQFLPSLRTRRSDEIPTDPGLCISDGFIASDGSERALEAINLSLRLKRWPDLRLSISTATEHKAEPSLLERRKERTAPDAFKSLIGQVRTLRQGRHDVGTIRAEESLVTMPTDHGYRIHLFRWESMPELNDPFNPSIIVKLETGVGSQVGRPPTITDKEAVELFDAVVNSIRLRPTKPVKSSAAEPPKAPLGTVSTTGHLCPQSGLWCAEEGEQRFITEGEKMPKTRVTLAPNLLQRLRGQHPVGELATHWTLVAFEAPGAEGATTADPPPALAADRAARTDNDAV